MYRGVQLPLKVTSLLDEADIRCWAAIKTAAVNAGLLTPLFLENDLVSDRAAPAFPVQFEPEVLQGCQAARDLANNELKLQPVADSEAIIALLCRREAALCTTYRTFRIDSQLFRSMHGDLGVSRLQSTLQAIMPTRTQPVELEQAAQQVSALESGCLFKVCTSTAQATVSSVLDNAMLLGRKPEWPAQATGLVADLQLRCECSAVVLVLTMRSGSATKPYRISWPWRWASPWHSAI